LTRRSSREIWEASVSAALQAQSEFFAGRLTRGEGLEAIGAAPLVFQGMCRREGLRVFFTEQPMTDGRSIWLGPVDASSPFAGVFIYAHGCHERHHVVYTDFSVLQGLTDRFVFALTNVLEDIRIDLKGADDYPGYLLWRRALFTVMDKSGEGAWLTPGSLGEARLLLLTLLMDLEVSVLGLEICEGALAKLRKTAFRRFGKSTCETLFTKARGLFPLASTAQALAGARTLAAYLKSRLGAVRLTEDPLPNSKASASRGQGSLFGDDGEATAEGMPAVLTAPDPKAKALAAALQGGDADDLGSEEAFRKFMNRRLSVKSDPSIGALYPEVPKRLRFGGTPEQKEHMKALFDEAWPASGGLRGVFEASLRHSVPMPVRLSDEGLEIDDNALALMSAGENAVFREEMPLPGRSAAFAVLLDTSGSMEPDSMTVAKVTALRVLEAVRGMSGLRACLALFPGARDRDVTPVADWQTPLSKTAATVRPVRGYGSTPILEALIWAGMTLEGCPEPARVIFLISDGTFDGEAVGAAVRDLAARGILTAMVGVGDYADLLPELSARASAAGDIPGAAARVLRAVSERLIKGAQGGRL
jgi:hypothetical protein